ncbi:extracellular solute-binding protein [Paenibacillus nanensis]|uniref:Extracellular solute-binding protein n=1 Tax=Paenibacillus nanensis TaxID=393251 RepID=A0A3A1VHL5_9BACL|nr:extracellular solute-binding protein [Paenibacillus nanensis]RIX60419.1 extracellular solute-binding protein [Paenibacillus nanensis]
MKKRMTSMLSMLFAAAAISGCSGNATVQVETPPAVEKISERSMEPVQLEVWAYYAGWESIEEGFEEKYPNVDLTVKAFPFDAYATVYKEALASGETPDVMVVDSEQFGQFTTIAGLENLADYGAEQYRADFRESLWDSNYSFDGTSMIGFPYGSSTLMTYYRADIMEQYGFPSEPEELALFMENPDNWLAVARALKKDDRYIAQWATEITALYDSTQGVFDESMAFRRNNETYRNALDFVKKVHEEGLVSLVDVWTEAGSQTVRDGDLAMLYMGTWGADQIKAWAPDTSGKWRATRLPFHLYGWSNSTSFMLPSASDQKAWAWAFIEYAATEWPLKGIGGSVPAYIPAREANAAKLEETDDFFGGQRLYVLNMQLTENMKEHRLTPLDGRAKGIWSQAVNKGIERKKDAAAIIAEAEQAILTEMGKEIDILKSYLPKSSQ